jgi:hypothetical protein
MCGFLDGTPCDINVHENDPRAVIALRTVATRMRSARGRRSCK